MTEEALKKAKKTPAAAVKKIAPRRKAATKEAETVTATPVAAPTVKIEEKAPAGPKDYLFAVGRRKRASALVRLYKNGQGNVVVNEKDFRLYFPSFEWQQAVTAPLQAVGQADKLDVSAKVSGGGVRGQAEAVRHGIARALLLLNPVFRRSLKKVGFLTRDPREKERKKYGLKGARRAPQWAKR